MKKHRSDKDDSKNVDQAQVATPCGAPAPIAVNGGGFAGCTRPAGHPDLEHVVEIKWKG